MAKRGLSNIVATVLIVLLALAAVAIVWGFLRPTFDRASSQTTLRSACFLVGFEPTQCTVNPATDVANVAYRLTSDDVKLSGAVVVIQDKSGLTYTSSIDTFPENAMESASATVVNVTGVGPYTMKVAAKVSDDTSTEVCPESVAIACG